MRLSKSIVFCLCTFSIVVLLYNFLLTDDVTEQNACSHNHPLHVFNILDIVNTANLSAIESSRGSTQYYSLRRPSVKTESWTPSVIILSIAKNSESFGVGRNLQHYFQMMHNWDYPKDRISFGLLISDKNDYESMKVILVNNLVTHGYKGATLIYKPDSSNITRHMPDRHNSDIQKERRRMLAKLRNYLLSTALDDEDAVLWIDADIIEIPNDLLKKMAYSRKDIIVPMCIEKSTKQEYDMNTWIGPRKKPSWLEQQEIASGKSRFVPDKTADTKFLHHLVNSREQFVEVDSVGGTVLYVTSDVHREGVVFPTQYIVGAGWNYEGYDAIETEGLCYLAKRLCYTCWGMPHDIVVHDAS